MQSLWPKVTEEGHFFKMEMPFLHFKSALFIASIIFTSLVSGFSPVNVWPQPKTISWPNPQANPLSPSLQILSPSHIYLDKAVSYCSDFIDNEHYAPLMPPSVDFSSSSPALEVLHIKVNDLVAPLQHGVNETYTLTIPSSGGAATLEAETVWGAIWGLETFSQLVWENPLRVVATGIYLIDAPLFPHRGLMLETSTSCYGIEDIKRTISAMSANKMNVFHWHIGDSHSFPLVIPSVPELASNGAYGPDMVYTPDDVKEIVEFGFSKGVRVIPEIDPPGNCHVNPLNRKTYQALKKVVADVVHLFPDPFYHGGAHKIASHCWLGDPSIQSFLSNGGTINEVLKKFINSTVPFIVSLNRTVIYWQNVFLDGLIKVDSMYIPPKHTILQTWNDDWSNTKKLVDAGYRVISSPSDFYCLDGDIVGNDGQYNEPPGSNQGNGAPSKTWETIYYHDIIYGLNKEEVKLVLGGEVVLSELADPKVLDKRLWPRSSAMAEALWSGSGSNEKGMNRYAEAAARLNEWRHRMVGRGIAAEPI